MVQTKGGPGRVGEVQGGSTGCALCFGTGGHLGYSIYHILDIMHMSDSISRYQQMCVYTMHCTMG